MAGHPLQCLLRDADIQPIFRALAAVSAPGGQSVFETRNLACVLWQN